MKTRPTVVCVTPVRNEAWTLERFLSSVGLWADHIILADQNSTDETRAIAERSPKVTLVENSAEDYNEEEGHRVLLEAARRIPGPRVIIAVDADEALSANVLDSPAWERVLASPPGTVITAEWINYLPGSEQAWVPKAALPIGFVDDGREHNPGHMHVERVVVRDDDAQVSLSPVVLLHFQYLDWARMKSKQRRYQCLEVLRHPEKRPTQIYRQYHRMDALPGGQMRAVDPSWLAGYEALGVELPVICSEDHYWWDEVVLDMLLAHGSDRFRRIDIWDMDWEALARKLDRDVPPGALRDPRTLLDRRIQSFLAATQRSSDRWSVRVLQRLLGPLGW